MDKALPLYPKCSCHNFPKASSKSQSFMPGSLFQSHHPRRLCALISQRKQLPVQLMMAALQNSKGLPLPCLTQNVWILFYVVRTMSIFLKVVCVYKQSSLKYISPSEPGKPKELSITGIPKLIALLEVETVGCSQDTLLKCLT